VDGETGGKQVAKERGTQAKVDGFMLPSDVASTKNVTRPGWIAKQRPNLVPRQVFTREELKSEHGMVYFKWDGVCMCFLSPHLIFAEKLGRTTHLLLDKRHCVISALVSWPHGAHDWGEVHDDTWGKLQSAAESLRFTANEEAGGRCGSFPTIAHGVSFGGGQEVRVYRCLLLSVLRGGFL